jgi:hypothetical protein
MKVSIIQIFIKQFRFDTGDNVRTLEKKDNFDKGKQKFSISVFKVDTKGGYKIIVEDERRKLNLQNYQMLIQFQSLYQKHIDRIIK